VSTTGLRVSSQLVPMTNSYVMSCHTKDLTLEYEMARYDPV